MTISRRSFTRTLSAAAVTAPLMAAGHKLNIGIGAYTYHSLTVDAMIEQMVALGIREMEMSRGEFMNFKKPPPAMFESFRSKIDKAGIRCVSYYAPTIKTEAAMDEAIGFAKILGCSNITGDPVGPVLKYVDQKVTAEKMTFGIHNHYFKNRKFDYESPEEILSALRDLSPSVGCTLDVGHIVSCGFDTMDAVKKLGPRLKLVHLKDIQAKGGEVNVPLGTGLCKIPDVMKELKRIKFTGLIAFEYEKDGEINEDVRNQIAYARKLA